MAAILKLRRQVENPTPSVDADLIEEQSCQISSRSDLKRRNLKLFKMSPQQDEEQGEEQEEQDGYP